MSWKKIIYEVNFHTGHFIGLHSQRPFIQEGVLMELVRVNVQEELLKMFQCCILSRSLNLVHMCSRMDLQEDIRNVLCMDPLFHSSPKEETLILVVVGGISEVFEKASQIQLAEPKRSPIGLNPERFVERCNSCKKWLLGERYGTKECAQCNSGGSKS